MIFPEKYEVQLIFLAKNLIDGLKREDDIKEIFNLLSSKKEIKILRRLKYYIACRHFLKLNTFIWDEIVNDNPLEFPSGKKEVSIFFSENAKNFDKSQIETILNWIEKIEYIDTKDEAKRIQDTAYTKKEWLNLLLLSENKKVLDMYKKYNQINSTELKKPGSSELITYWSKNSSPFKIEELKSLSVTDLIDKINNYKENLTGELDPPSKEGLAETLELLISKNPVKYVEHFNMILEKLDPYYLYYFMKRLKKVDSEKKIFSWPSFLNSMQDYIESFGWSEKRDDSFLCSEEFLKEFFSLISEEISEENSNIDFSNVEVIKNILIASLDKYHSRETLWEGRVVELIFNSLSGTLLECTISYLLWVAKNKFKDDDIRWEDEFKAIFEKKLDSPYRDREYSAVLGMFFRNLLYIDESWIWNNFNRIFPKESNESFWKDTMSSFLFRNKGDKETYKRFRKDGHYKKVLETDFCFDEERAVINHACIAYLLNIEEYDKSLIKHIIDSCSTSHIEKMIQSLCHEDFGSDANKIKKIWDEIYDRFKNTDDNNKRRIVVGLALLQKHFNCLEENFSKLKDSFRFCRFDDYEYLFEFLEMLKKFVESEPGLTGDLILESIDGGVFFSYDKDILKAIIEKMYELNEKDKANRICNAYLGRGIEWLRELYDKNNQT